eukprot:Opistho-1_new@47870
MTSNGAAAKTLKGFHLPAELAYYRNPYYLVDFAADVIETTWEARALARASPDERQRRRTQLRRFVLCLIKRANVSSESVLAGLMWIERLKARYPRAEGGEKCGHRLFLVALIVASKMFADGPKSSRDWSAVSGVFDSAELERMEDEFLTFLQDDIRISTAAFEEFVSKRLGTDQVVPMHKPAPPVESSNDVQAAPSVVAPSARPVAPPVARVKSARKLEEPDDVGIVPDFKRSCVA